MDVPGIAPCASPLVSTGPAPVGRLKPGETCASALRRQISTRDCPRWVEKPSSPPVRAVLDRTSSSCDPAPCALPPPKVKFRGTADSRLSDRPMSGIGARRHSPAYPDRLQSVSSRHSTRWAHGPRRAGPADGAFRLDNALLGQPCFSQVGWSQCRAPRLRRCQTASCSGVFPLSMADVNQVGFGPRPDQVWPSSSRYLTTDVKAFFASGPFLALGLARGLAELSSDFGASAATDPSVAKDSSERPLVNPAFSQFGFGPRPPQVLPDASRYLTDEAGSVDSALSSARFFRVDVEPLAMNAVFVVDLRPRPNSSAVRP